MDSLPLPAQALQTNTPAPVQRQNELRAAAQELEASFLAEMLRHTGIGEARKTGGGGAGEEAFAGFLADEYGEALAERGGIGLADRIFEVLVAREQNGSAQ